MDRNTERHGCYLLLVLALVVPALSVEMTFLYEDEGSGMTCSYVHDVDANSITMAICM